MRGRLFSLNDPGQLLEMRSIGERYILIRKEWNHFITILAPVMRYEPQEIDPATAGSPSA